MFKRPLIPTGVIWLGRNIHSPVCMVDQQAPIHMYHDESTVLRHTSPGYKWEGHKVKHMLRYEPAHILWLTSNNRLHLREDLLKKLATQVSDRNLVNMMNTEAQELKLNMQVPAELPPPATGVPANPWHGDSLGVSGGSYNNAMYDGSSSSQ